MENKLIAAIAAIVESLKDAEDFDEFSAHAALLSVREQLAALVGATQAD